jgi:hypothetical protein
MVWEDVGVIAKSANNEIAWISTNGLIPGEAHNSL